MPFGNNKKKTPKKPCLSKSITATLYIFRGHKNSEYDGKIQDEKNKRIVYGINAFILNDFRHAYLKQNSSLMLENAKTQTPNNKNKLLPFQENPDFVFLNYTASLNPNETSLDAN